MHREAGHLVLVQAHADGYFVEAPALFFKAPEALAVVVTDWNDLFQLAQGSLQVRHLLGVISRL